ncbi:UBP44 hydrolase, partial [Amia calva]|nr:UBP44 hydrolase [Amia calva]
MDKCKHVGRLRLAQDHSILNPQKWHCVDCNTTESVWACLGCSHVACGRYIEEHALKHFQERRHPVAMEVNELYVFCYLCDDYVLNDNATGDLRLLRGTLGAIKSQNYMVTTRSPAARRETQERREELKRRRKEELECTPPRKSHRLLELNQKSRPSRKSLAPAHRGLGRGSDRKQTPGSWRGTTVQNRKLGKACRQRSQPPTSANTPTSSDEVLKLGDSPIRRRPTVTPGVTGLRNLGNTCYMNSILQVLSHLHIFRECFLQLDLNQALELLASAVNGNSRPPLCKLVMAHGKAGQPSFPLSKRGMSAGLSGGASRTRNMELIQPKEPSSNHISLCHELHTLFQVMWSGKWALVSPFAMLNSVWQLIPAFRGYAQQDAQEFLCELLDKVQRELETTGTLQPAQVPAPQRKLIKKVLNVVNTIFHGQLLSQVTCLACDNKSNTIEPFWDLSLEFPERYHCNGKETAAQFPCLLTEMLAKFTETEALEGNIYACDQCNSKRRRFSSKPIILTEAQKQLMIHKLPQVLRLHLKRFRWSGRNHREKIGVHVSFDQILNMEPYCCRDSTGSLKPDCFVYELSAVVMHHGKGFGSGHYTAYCYNTEGGFWVHCNDSKLNICTVDEVCKTQAYILFYTQRVSQDKGKSL